VELQYYGKELPNWIRHSVQAFGPAVLSLGTRLLDPASAGPVRRVGRPADSFRRDNYLANAFGSNGRLTHPCGNNHHIAVSGRRAFRPGKCRRRQNDEQGRD
jgi:hypothetical protein